MLLLFVIICRLTASLAQGLSKLLPTARFFCSSQNNAYDWASLYREQYNAWLAAHGQALIRKSSVCCQTRYHTSTRSAVTGSSAISGWRRGAQPGALPSCQSLC